MVSTSTMVTYTSTAPASPLYKPELFLFCYRLALRAIRAYILAIYILRIHLATALGAQQFLDAQGYPPLTFLSADERLNHAAGGEGLAVDKPNHHA